MMTFKDKYARLEIVIYAVSWILVFLIPVGIECYDVYSGDRTALRWDNVWNAETLLFPIFLFFLLNNFVLLPQLFFKDRKIWYFLVVACIFAFFWYIQEPPRPRHISPHPRPMGQRPPVDMFHVTNLIIELCVALGNFAIKIYVQSLRKDVFMLHIQKEKILSELESLKYQISPHFLMNTLNNIQSLIESDTSKAYYTLQGLSRMMRYMLYENVSDSVSLQKEVDFMSDFIGMMKIRYTDKVHVSAEFPIDCGDVQVPPLLFISFLENAFKHGISYSSESFVTVNMTLENDTLIFKCANSKRAGKTRQKTRKGLGLENVRKRLQLIYGNDFAMNISSTDLIYMVEVEIPVSVTPEKAQLTYDTVYSY